MKTTNKLLSLTTFVAAAMSFAFPAWATDYIWTGDGTDGNWTTAGNWNPSTGWENDSGNNVTFGNVTNKEVTISSDTEIIAGALTVSAAYTLTFEEGASLTVTKFNEAKGSLELAGSGTLTISSYSQLYGTITVTEGMTVIFSSTVEPQSGTIKVEGGSVKINMIGYESSQATIDVSGGSVEISNSVNATATDGHGFKLYNSGGSLTINGSVSTYEGTLKFSAGTTKITGNVTLWEGSSINVSGGTTTINGVLTMQIGTNERWGSSLSMTDGSLTVAGLDIGVLSSATISGGTITIGDSGITVDGSGSLQLGISIATTGTVAFSSPVAEVGSVTVDHTPLVLTESFLDDNVGKGYVTVIEASSITYSGVELSEGDTLNTFVLDAISYGSDAYEVAWEYYNGTLYANIVDPSAPAAPEPLMFGLFAGLMAVGLVATRRRRRA